MNIPRNIKPVKWKTIEKNHFETDFLQKLKTHKNGDMSKTLRSFEPQPNFTGSCKTSTDCSKVATGNILT